MKSASKQDKKVYTPPRLVRHGTVEQITQNLGTGTPDAQPGSQIAP